MLKIQDLNQFYGGSHILRDLSFEVPMGQVTALLGRNGVGKTTLMKCLMGLVPARSGSVRFGDDDVTHAAPHARAALGIGYVPQGREIFSLLTVEENLLMGLATQPAGSRIPDLVFELFPVLKSMLHRRGGDLSGGQQQQLAIGRALAMNPKLLILDEPTEGIQPSIIKDIGHAIRVVAQRRKLETTASQAAEERAEVQQAIRHVAQTGRVAVLLVEQYYDFARDLADHYLLMGLATQRAGSRIPDLVFDLFPVLKSMLRRRGGDLSGGQQQQLAIGRALAMNPKLLILDEPTEGIQPSIIKDIGHAIRVVAQRQKLETTASQAAEERAEVQQAIRHVAQTGRVAVLLVEQYYDFARDLADHYLLMERGEFIMRGLGCNMDRDGVREALAV